MAQARPGIRRASGASSLERAAMCGDVAQIRALLAAGAAPAPGALVRAVEAGVPESVTALLEAGADPGASDARGVPPLFAAAAGGHPALEAFLADPDRADLRAPHSPTSGHGEILWALLDRGADPNARVAPRRSRSAPGVTPLMVAAAFNNTPAVDVLVARGADLFAKDFAGRTARNWGERTEHPGVTTRLRSFSKR